MAKKSPAPVNSAQTAFDFSYLGYAVVTQEKTEQKKLDDASVIARAEKVAKITVGELIQQYGPAEKFKPESRPLFEEPGKSAPAIAVPPSPAPVIAPALEMPTPVAKQQAIAPAPQPALKRANAPEENGDEHTVIIPRKEKRLPPPKDVGIPVNSAKGLQLRKQQIAAERAEESKKGEAGRLMRTVHTSDGRLRKTQLPENMKIESIAAQVNAGTFFNPWADMIRARNATKEAEPVIEEAVRHSSPKPRF